MDGCTNSRFLNKNQKQKSLPKTNKGFDCANVNLDGTSSERNCSQHTPDAEAMTHICYKSRMELSTGGAISARGVAY